jgi:hypothetical protein
VTVDLRETCVDRSSTSGEITPGESEWGEVETPEARRAEVIYSRRSMEDMRQQITYFRSGEKATWSRETPEVDPHRRMRGTCGARSLTSEENTREKRWCERPGLPNVKS